MSYSNSNSRAQALLRHDPPKYERTREDILASIASAKGWLRMLEQELVAHQLYAAADNYYNSFEVDALAAALKRII